MNKQIKNIFFKKRSPTKNDNACLSTGLSYFIYGWYASSKLAKDLIQIGKLNSFFKKIFFVKNYFLYIELNNDSISNSLKLIEKLRVDDHFNNLELPSGFQSSAKYILKDELFATHLKPYLRRFDNCDAKQSLIFILE